MKFSLLLLILAILCVSQSTGETRWTSLPLIKCVSLGVSDGEVFALSKEGELFCLNNKDGKLMWKRNLGVSPVSSGDFNAGSGSGRIEILENGRIVLLGIPETTGKVLILDAKGNLLETDGNNAVRFQTVSNLILYLDSLDGVVSIDSDGKRNWSYKAVLTSTSNICFHNKMVLITYWPLGIFALDLDSGRPIWQKKNSAIGPGCISYAENRILFPTTDEISLMNDSGDNIWTHSFALDVQGSLRITPVIFNDGNILCAFGGGTLECISPTGTLLWKTPALGPLFGPPIAGANNIIYLVANGKLIALNSDGRIFTEFAPKIQTDQSPVIDFDGNLIIALSGGGICSITNK